MRCKGLSLITAALLSGCGVPVPSGVDASSPDVAGAADAQGPLGAGSCAQATPVGSGTSRAAETLEGAQAGVGCLGAVRSVSYRITVPAGQVLTVTASSPDGPVVLQVLEGCEATRCLAQSSTAGLSPLRAQWHNDGAAAREVRVLAGSFSTWAGRFSIGFSLDAAAGNLRCASAEPLRDGDWRGEQRFGPSAEPAALCSDRQAPTAAGLRWYRVDVPPRSVAVATVTPGPTFDGREFGVAAVMRSACDTSACVASTPVLLRGRGGLVGANDGDAPRSLLLAVGVDPPQAEGTFSLALAIRPRDEAARCERAEALAEGVEARGDTTLSDATLPLCGTESAGGPVRFHRVTIPPGRFLELRGTTTVGRPLALRALSSCADTRCVAGSGSGVPAYLRVPNLTDAPMALTVAAGAREADARVPYALLARFVPPDPAGRCEGAEAFNARTLSVVTHHVAERGPRCDGDEMGPARWLRVTVPPNTAMRFTASSADENGEAVPALVRVLESCDAARCAASGVTQASWGNTSDVPRELLVAVGLAGRDARGAISFYMYPQALAPNSLCIRATAVREGAPAQREQSTQALASAPWCDGRARSSRWYTATVPAGAVLHAWAKNPFSGFSSGMPSLALRAGCDDACAAEGTVPSSRGAHLWWRNNARTDLPVWIQAGWEALSGGYYDLGVETFAPELPRCGEADPLPAGATLGAVRGEAGATSCAATHRGPVRWYRASVGAGRTLRVTASVAVASPTVPLELGVHDGCEGACLATTRAATTAAVSWRNDSGAAREVRVSLTAADGAPLTAVSLSSAQE